MSTQESKRPVRPDSGVLKRDLADEEAFQRMFDYGLPRKKPKGSVSNSGEDVQGIHQEEARMAVTRRHGPS